MGRTGRLVRNVGATIVGLTPERGERSHNDPL